MQQDDEEHRANCSFIYLLVCLFNFSPHTENSCPIRGDIHNVIQNKQVYEKGKQTRALYISKYNVYKIFEKTESHNYYGRNKYFVPCTQYVLLFANHVSTERGQGSLPFVKWLLLMLIFWRSRVHVTSLRPIIITEVFDFTQFLRHCSLNWGTAAAFHVFWHSQLFVFNSV